MLVKRQIKTKEKISDNVASGYKKIENGVVGAYKKIEDGFVDQFLTHDGETVEDAKIRLSREQKERCEKAKTEQELRTTQSTNFEKKS